MESMGHSVPTAVAVEPTRDNGSIVQTDHVNLLTVTDQFLVSKTNGLKTVHLQMMMVT